MDDLYVKNVQGLLSQNSVRKTAKILGVDPSTIRYWLKQNFNVSTKNFSETVTDCKEYAFILGFYLGDGTISKAKRTYKLRLFNTFQYENINNYVLQCMAEIFPKNKPNRCKKIGAWEMYVYNSKMLELFPQAGKGRKHDRKITLEDWQWRIVDNYLEEFIKGLIYSDGCIVYSNGFKRYEFVNASTDIHEILSESLEKLGIHKTSTRRKCPNPENPSHKYQITTISQRDEVDKLSLFIPDKS